MGVQLVLHAVLHLVTNWKNSMAIHVVAADISNWTNVISINKLFMSDDSQWAPRLGPKWWID